MINKWQLDQWDADVKAAFDKGYQAGLVDGRKRVGGEDAREILADYAHRAWAHWMVHVYSRVEFNENGSATIPPELAKRWHRQMWTKYADLPEDEKESDRHQASEIIKLLKSITEEL